MVVVVALGHGENMRPTAFFSRVVPILVQGMPACLITPYMCAMAVEAAMTITLRHDTVLHITHHVLHVLKKNLLYKLSQTF